MAATERGTKLNYNPPKDDGSTYRIELQGVSVGIMKQILDFIFSGEVTLREETIQDMVQASDLLLMADLKSLCSRFLESCITAENCIGIRLFALHYCLYHVHHVATEFLHTHFRDVARSEEFRELPPERLCELLSMEKLNVGNEEHVLEAAVRWFAHDPEGRRVRMREVMSAVWLQGLDASYLREQATGEPLTRELISAVQLCGVDVSFLREQAAQQPLMKEVIREYCQPVLTQRRLQARGRLAAFKPRGYSECIVIAGGEDRLTGRLTAATRCMCPLYDANRQAWIELRPMSVARLGHGLVAAGGFLFVMGGTDELNTVLGSGEKYDPDSNTWSPIPPMLQARHHFGVVELDGLIYVLGGENEGAELITVEVFDPYFNTWKTQTSMTMVHKVGCYASMNKKVYAIGGASYGKQLDSVECFDPRTQQWTGLCPLMERRFGSVACAVGQELYVFGGVRSQENDSLQMMTSKSELYHNGRWMFLDDQNLCSRANCSLVYGAVPIGASIYVVGQLDTGTTFDYIREFHRSTETWHRTKQMSRSDLAKPACAKLRIANCCLFRLQLSQGMFRIRI